MEKRIFKKYLGIFILGSYSIDCQFGSYDGLEIYGQNLFSVLEIGYRLITTKYKWMAICRLAILQNDSMAKKRLLPWESLGENLVILTFYSASKMAMIMCA